jgi:aminopeptidase N
MKNCSTWILMFALSAGLALAQTPGAYELGVVIHPESGKIDVTGRVSVELDRPGQESFAFHLNEAFRITSLKINDLEAEYVFEDDTPSRMTPTARKVSVRLPAGIRSQYVEMSISYSGKLEVLPPFGTPDSDGPFLDDTINSSRVELANYSSWYPSFGFGARFETDVEISIPNEWTIACIGKASAQTDRSMRFTAKAANDIVIVASPRFKVKEVDTDSGSVLIYHTRLPERFVLREAEETEKTLRFYTGELGSPPLSDGVVKHVYSPRELGQGGYARTGMTVASEGRVLELLADNPDASLLRGMAHELGHFWWNFGTGQGDWMNETFAEYFSLLAVKEIQGHETFEAALAQRKNAVLELPLDAPPLATVPASNDGHGYTVRYYKGALMLDHFRRLMGDEAFFDTCRGFYQQNKDKRVGTASFRASWTKALGNYEEWVGKWLESGGPSPVDISSPVAQRERPHGRSGRKDRVRRAPVCSRSFRP